MRLRTGHKSKRAIIIMGGEQNQQLTKRERRLLRRQQEEEEQLRLIRRKKIKKLVAITLPILVIGAWLTFSLKNYASENQGAAKLEISQQEYDAGTVSLARGLVKHTYEIKNAGDGDLEINKIWTSCMCTSAVLKVGEKTSPKFGMHDNPAFWSQNIGPGETGFLEVTFDPAFHGPEGAGPVTRAIYLSTNDSQNKQAEVRLLANVIR